MGKRGRSGGKSSVAWYRYAARGCKRKEGRKRKSRQGKKKKGESACAMRDRF